MAEPTLVTPAYVPPQPMFRRCRCGALVLKTKAGILTPALGYPHMCAQAKEKVA